MKDYRIVIKRGMNVTRKGVMKASNDVRNWLDRHPDVTVYAKSFAIGVAYGAIYELAYVGTYYGLVALFGKKQ